MDAESLKHRETDGQQRNKRQDGGIDEAHRAQAGFAAAQVPDDGPDETDAPDGQVCPEPSGDRIIGPDTVSDIPWQLLKIG